MDHKQFDEMKNKTVGKFFENYLPWCWLNATKKTQENDEIESILDQNKWPIFNKYANLFFLFCVFKYLLQAFADMLKMNIWPE